MLGYKEIFADLFALRTTAAHVLAATVLDLFPRAKLLGGGGSRLGFYYDFFLTITPFPDLSIFEDRMRKFCKEGRPIRLQEMVTASAVGYLDHLKLGHRKGELKGSHLHHFISIGAYTDLARAAPLSSVSSLVHFSLTGIEHFEGGRVRISGTAFQTKEELKSFVKGQRLYKESGYLQVAAQWKFYSVQGTVLCLLPKGVIFKNLIEKEITSRVEKRGFVPLEILEAPGRVVKDSKTAPCVVGSTTVDQIGSLCLQSKFFQWVYEKNEEGERVPFLDQDHARALYQAFFLKPPHLSSEITSSLQFILEIFTMLELKIEPVLILSSRRGGGSWFDESVACIKREFEGCSLAYRELHIPLKKGKEAGIEVRFYTRDKLQRSWLLASLEVEIFRREDASGESVFVRLSPCSSLDRVMALIWEKGQIPFWLSPVQYRIIPVKDEERAYGEEVLTLLTDQLGRRAEIDLKFEEPLSERVYRAESEQIPLIVCLGRRERERRTISLRRRGQERVEELNLDEWETRGVKDQ